jgi:hypothetical protein
MTSVMQLSITAASLCVAAAAIIFAIKSMSDERNARLVEVGVSVLRADPEKEDQVSAARKWALDLIDANAGGVKFSAEARAQLLKKRLAYDTYDYGGGGYTGGDFSSRGGFGDVPQRPPAKGAPAVRGIQPQSN